MNVLFIHLLFTRIIVTDIYEVSLPILHTYTLVVLLYKVEYLPKQTNQIPLVFRHNLPFLR